MSNTIIGQPSRAFPLVFNPPVIHVRRKWGDPWSYAPDLEMLHCGLYASSSAVSALQFKRKFGDRKMPFDPAFLIQGGVEMDGWWAQLSITGDRGSVVQHVGIIEASATDMKGSTAVQAGEQTFVAYGGLRLLQKIEIGSSLFVNEEDGEAAPVKVEWIPSMNARDRRHLLVGNQAPAGFEADGVTPRFFYGGKDLWTHLEYLRYVLANFVQQPTGPKWTVGGQTDILDAMKTTIDFPEVAKASDILRELIPVKYGVDYFVAPTTDGFEIRVFSLSDRNQAFAGVTLPRNPNTITVVRSEQPEMFDIKVVESSERRVDRIVVQGKRITVCGSLYGDSNGSTSTGGMSLVARWTPALEDVYKDADGLVSAGGQTDSSKFDEARKREKFVDVYQHVGAPDGWDKDGGIWSPACNDDGSLTTGPFQTAQRETLDGIPLKVGFDYSTNPPTDQTNGVMMPDVQRPLAWLVDEANNIPGGNGGYFQCDLHGISVHRPFHDWGLILQASPNHQLALNSWDAGDQGTTTSYPMFDYNTCIATIAMESDHRVRLAYTVPSNLAAGDGSIMTITDEGAELWTLLPQTVVGLTPQGNLKDSGSALQILRDDRGRLGLIACGVIARYIAERFRVQIDWKGHAAWGGLLGQMLTEIRGGSFLQQFASPLTSIEWTMGAGDPRTVLKFGYA